MRELSSGPPAAPAAAAPSPGRPRRPGRPRAGHAEVLGARAVVAAAWRADRPGPPFLRRRPGRDAACL